jgi:hypothetical protein
MFCFSINSTNAHGKLTNLTIYQHVNMPDGQRTFEREARFLVLLSDQRLECQPMIQLKSFTVWINCDAPRCLVFRNHTLPRFLQSHLLDYEWACGSGRRSTSIFENDRLSSTEISLGTAQRKGALATYTRGAWSQKPWTLAWCLMALKLCVSNSMSSFHAFWFVLPCFDKAQLQNMSSLRSNKAWYQLHMILSTNKLSSCCHVCWMVSWLVNIICLLDAHASPSCSWTFRRSL